MLWGSIRLNKPERKGCFFKLKNYCLNLWIWEDQYLQLVPFAGFLYVVNFGIRIVFGLSPPSLPSHLS